MQEQKEQKKQTENIDAAVPQSKPETQHEKLAHTDVDSDGQPDIIDSSIDPSRDMYGYPKNPPPEDEPKEEPKEEPEKEQEKGQKQEKEQEKAPELPIDEEIPDKHLSKEAKEFFESQKVTISTPFLIPLVKKQMKQITKLTDKKTKLEEKKEKQSGKLEKLRNKLQSENAYCDKIKELVKSGAFSEAQVKLINAYLERRQDKIDALESKIKESESKVKRFEDKIKGIDSKIARKDKKIADYVDIDVFMSNMLTSEGRKENFVTSLEKMRDKSVSQAIEKSVSLDKQITRLKANPPSTRYVSEQIQYTKNLEKLEAEKARIVKRIAGMNEMDGNIRAVANADEKEAEKIVTTVHGDIETAMSSENAPKNPNEIIDTIVDTSAESINTARHMIIDEAVRQEASKQQIIKVNASEFETLAASKISFNYKSEDKDTFYVQPLSSHDSDKIKGIIKAVRTIRKAVQNTPDKAVKPTIGGKTK